MPFVVIKSVALLEKSFFKMFVTTDSYFKDSAHLIILHSCYTGYRLVQSGNTANGGCSAGQGSSEL
jgi:hypothetical protein